MERFDEVWPQKGRGRIQFMLLRLTADIIEIRLTTYIIEVRKL